MKVFAFVAALIPGVAAADCAVERDLVFDLMERNGLTLSDRGSFGQIASKCRIRGMQISADNVDIEVGLMEWRLKGLDLVASGRGQVSVDGRVEGLRIVPTAEDPWIGYMLSEQTRRNLIDAEVQAVWSLDDGALELDALQVDFPGDNELSLGFTIAGLTPRAIAGQIGDLAQISVESLGATVENNGFADGLILGALVGRMAEVPGSPETVIDGTKTELARAVSALPDTLFMGNSKRAVLSLIDDAPVPWGTGEVSLVAEEGLPVSRFLVLGVGPVTPEASGRALEGARIFVNYRPSATAR